MNNAEDLKSAKTLTTVIYALYAASFFVGLTAIVGIILNYLKKMRSPEPIWRATFAGKYGLSGSVSSGR